jgi:hypothetical protein
VTPDSLGDSLTRLASSGPDESTGDAGHPPLRELPELLTLFEVAKVLRCSKAHACKLVNGQVAGTPQLLAINLGRRKLVKRATLMRWLAENEQSASMSGSLEVNAGRRA